MLSRKLLWVALLSFVSAALPGAAFAAKESDPKLIRMQWAEFDPLAEPPARTAARAKPVTVPRNDRITQIVQFTGEAGEDSRKLLKKYGLRVTGYLPDDAYVVIGKPHQFDKVRANPDIRWIGEYLPEYKIAPQLLLGPVADEMRRANEAPVRYELALWPGETPDRVIAEIKVCGGQNVVVRESDQDQGARLLFDLPGNELLAIAALSEISWIEPAPRLTRRLDTIRGIVQSGTVGGTPFYDNGIFGDGQIVGHIDGDINYDMCYFADDSLTTNTPGLSHRKIIAYYDGTHPFDSLGTRHGTATASIIAGQITSPTLTLSHAGIAPGARLVHGYDLKVEGISNTPSTLKQTLERHQADGAFIHSNSWGDDTMSSYTFWCQDIDAFTYENEDALVVFAATNLSTLRTPENAKNVLAVGATRRTPNIDTRYIGGVGPTNDGRRKPEIFAPGHNNVMADYETLCGTFISSGTSYAAPVVAGAAALVRQYYTDGYYPTGAAAAADQFTPSGALLKATLLNGATDMTAEPGYPSNTEGWGRLLADNAVYFAGDDRRSAIFDIRHDDGFTGAGQHQSFLFDVTSSAENLRVTLVWNDPPAQNGANPALINNLDLSLITPELDSYKGNNFVGGVSAPGGNYDDMNNVEQLLIPTPPIGQYYLQVLPGQIPMGPQGFALVISGAVSNAEHQGEDNLTAAEHWTLYH